MMNKIIKVIVLLGSIATMSVFGNENTIYPEGAKGDVYHPYNPRTRIYKPNKLKDNDFMIKLGKDPKKLDALIKNRDRYKRTLSGTRDIKIASYPRVENLKTILFLEVSPLYSSKIILPSGYIITHSESSSPLDALGWDENIVKFKPLKNFLDGNLDIYATNKKQNIVVTVILKKHSNDTNMPFYPMLVLKSMDSINQESIHLSDWEVIEKYKELHGSLDFQRYGVVYINNQPYYIIVDNINGQLLYKGKAYRVSRKLGGVS